MDKIIPTVGHHFSDYLICKQKAWLHYHGNPGEKLKPPVELRVMQAEGQRLEELIYQTRYPEAYKAPGFGKNREIRITATRDAMTRGEPVILQGYMEIPEGNGTLDVMELIGKDSNSLTGNSYKVGEIKRSEKLMTAHIMQVSWYTELLEQAYWQKVKDGFFLLGAKNNQRHEENLESFRLDYLSVKEALFELRDSKKDPGPHLIRACLSCDWRGVCMPRLVRENHLSLIPLLTQNQVSFLKADGYGRWQDIKKINDDLLLEIGLNPFNIEVVRKGFENLSTGLAPLITQFRKDLFDGAVVVGFDFGEIPATFQEKKELRPNKIHWYDGLNIQTRKINYDENGAPYGEIGELIVNKLLVFYGGTDLGVFAKILKNHPVPGKPKLFNLFTFVEEQVHYPFPGLELSTITKTISNQKTGQSGIQRVLSIMQVIQWLTASL